MSSSRLPRIHRGVAVDAATGRQDRVFLELGTWSFDGDDADMAMVLQHLSEHFVIPNVPASDIRQPVFRAPQGRGWPRKVEFAQPIRHGSSPVGVPLMGGFLRVARSGAQGNSRFEMKFHLSLNPTRFMAHQPGRRELLNGSDAGIGSVLPVSLLTRRLGRTDEISLLGDNVLIGVRSFVMARPTLWPLWLRGYLATAIATLHATLESAFEVAISARLAFIESYSLQEVETYWEFGSLDPVREVHRLADAVGQYGPAFGWRIYSNVEAERTREGNSLVLSVGAGAGRRIKVYAKAAQRVRIEVTHDLTHVSGFGPHTTTRASDILDMLARTSELGASDLNGLLRHLDQSLGPSTEQQASPYALVAAIVSAAPDPRTHKPLLAILINEGAISLEDRNPFRHAVDKLLKAKVLRRTRRSGQTFALTGTYHEARRRLVSADVLSTRTPD